MDMEQKNIMSNTKFKGYVHKSCSCFACKRGRTKKNRLIEERKYRHVSKIELNINVDDFENKYNSSVYTD